MIIAIFSLSLLGLVLGLGLGFADRIFKVETNPFIAEVEAMMPGSNCGQCGFPGCASAARAIVEGEATVTICPPGGKNLATALATRLGVSLDLSQVKDDGPKIAFVAEELCIGCCRCSKVCPTDALIGAAKQIHDVLRDACTGCSSCIEKCPTEALSMKPIPVTLQHWIWPKPIAA
ncbi:RnfABCDGE type electron transport complex subunit B [Propionivibrio sp.]|uniref:RnfABCDGE type electron transport complex subunit B n=1 Tax=Propionivibrio sp. TaxID=2212460 RepID=UPI003BF2B326